MTSLIPPSTLEPLSAIFFKNVVIDVFSSEFHSIMSLHRISCVTCKIGTTSNTRVYTVYVDSKRPVLSAFLFSHACAKSAGDIILTISFLHIIFLKWLFLILKMCETCRFVVENLANVLVIIVGDRRVRFSCARQSVGHSGSDYAVAISTHC